jgi:hypothetical protein
MTATNSKGEEAHSGILPDYRLYPRRAAIVGFI